MSSPREFARRLYAISGVRRAHLAAHRAALRARGGAIRNETGVLLYADPADERGVLLSRMRGALDRNAVAVWRRLVDETRPAVTIDVGANYGEVSFCTRYPDTREMHLVEPNPAVLPWLRRTVAECAEAYPPIHLHAAAASDRTGTARLGLAGPHSGTASLAGAGASTIEVPTFRLDERIDLRAGDSLLFKVDVEGHERSVLEGMSGLLKAGEAVGLCEVQRADDALVDYLCGNFAVHVVRAGYEIPVDARDLRAAVEVGEATGWRHLSKDVVLRPAG